MAFVERREEGEWRLEFAHNIAVSIRVQSSLSLALTLSANPNNQLPPRPPRLQPLISLTHLLKRENLLNHRLHLPILHPLSNLLIHLHIAIRHHKPKLPLPPTQKSRPEEDTQNVLDGRELRTAGDGDILTPGLEILVAVPVQISRVEDVVDDVIILRSLAGEVCHDICGAVVEDLVRAEGFTEVDVGAGAGCGYVAAERFGDLDLVGAHAAAAAVEEDFGAVFDEGGEGLEGGEAADADGGGVFELDAVGDGTAGLLAYDEVFCYGAEDWRFCFAEYRLAGFQVRERALDDRAGEVKSRCAG